MRSHPLSLLHFPPPFHGRAPRSQLHVPSLRYPPASTHSPLSSLHSHPHSLTLPTSLPTPSPRPPRTLPPHTVPSRSKGTSTPPRPTVSRVLRVPHPAPPHTSPPPLLRTLAPVRASHRPHAIPAHGAGHGHGCRPPQHQPAAPRTQPVVARLQNQAGCLILKTHAALSQRRHGGHGIGGGGGGVAGQAVARKRVVVGAIADVFIVEVGTVVVVVVAGAGARAVEGRGVGGGGGGSDGRWAWRGETGWW